MTRFPTSRVLAKKPWLRIPKPAITTLPTVVSLDVASSRLPGGVAVTITGTNFRLNSDGSAPSVLFGGVAATSVVVVSSTTITVVAPAASVVGLVDVTVTIGSESGTLVGGFLYFAGTLASVSPSFTAILTSPSVLVKGHSFIAGSTFTFNGLAATDVTFIDDTQYALTVPASAQSGYVDVVMTETGGATSTLRNGFQYTLLNRGASIRRNPGIVVQRQLGSSPETAQLCLDGQGRKPITGEELVITDEEDFDRVLFRGSILTSDLTYEGQRNQLVWSCTVADQKYQLNKYRPFGSYLNVSASEIVADLLHKFALSDFSSAAVQQGLALVSISFDGTKSFSECMDDLADAIGGGRWYIDYDRVIHFFHPKVNEDFILPPSTGSGADFTPAVISVGAGTGSLVPFTVGYYAVRVAFRYSNGAISRLGPTSNVIGFDGTKFIHIASLPIGLNPSGSITCVGREIFYLRGSDELASGWSVNDNVTTSIDVTPVMTDTATVTNNDGDPVTIQDTGSSGSTVSQPPAPSGALVLYGLVPNGSGHRIYFGGHLTARTDVSGGFHIDVGLSYGMYRFKVAAVYADGSVSLPSEPCPADSDTLTESVVFGPIPIGSGGGVVSWTYSDDGTTYNSRGYDGFFNGVPVFPVVNGVSPVKFRLYAGITTILGMGVGVPLPPGFESVGGGNAARKIGAPDYVAVGDIPYFKVGGDGSPVDPITLVPLNTTVTIPATRDFGSQPEASANSPEQTLTWPNPDGPYLEDTWFPAPHDIDDDDMDLLHEDSGSQKFVLTEDVSQLRNRVKVFGSSSVTTAEGQIGDVTVSIADPTQFSIHGGQVISGNGVLLEFFSVSSLIAGSANLLLTEPLSAGIPAGTTVSYYCQVDDTQSQRDRGSIELDKNGNPTDGVHEYVVSDPSLNSVQQVYLRAHAEIDVYSKPILTVRYATRDPNTRPGAVVHIDLSDPPCQGDFLIQSVTIDQIHDESDMLFPRYTVVASSVVFDLVNFLLTLAQGSSPTQSAAGTGGSSGIGVVDAAVNQSDDSTGNPTLGSRKTGSGKAASVAAVLAPSSGTMLSVGGVTFATGVGGTFLTPKYAQGMLWIPASINSNAGANGVLRPSATIYFSSLNLRPTTLWRVLTPATSELRYGSGAENAGPAVQAWVGWSRNSDSTFAPGRPGVYIGMDATQAYDGILNPLTGGTFFKNTNWWLVYLNAASQIVSRTRICTLQQDTVYDLELVAVSDSEVQASVTPLNGTTVRSAVLSTDLANVSLIHAGWISTNVNAADSLLWCNEVVWSSN